MPHNMPSGSFSAHFGNLWFMDAVAGPGFSFSSKPVCTCAGERGVLSTTILEGISTTILEGIAAGLHIDHSCSFNVYIV